ncbi:MAG: RluA family pseudouridine synthase [Mucinivorans sp.]
MKNNIFIATEQGTVLDFLFKQCPAESRTTIKAFLRNRQISVNGCMTTHFDFPIKNGDKIEISTEHTKQALRHPMIRIVWEDDYLLVVEKRSGLLSIATDKESKRTAYFIISEYLKSIDPSAKVFVVHRLDRETSGLMIFAKDEHTKFAMQSAWNDTVIERKYVAVTEGVFQDAQGVISTYLTESKALKVYATTRENGKIASTAYKVLKTSVKKNLSLIELELATGRKNQIRAHLEHINHPIIGDKKYGATAPSPIDRVALHAMTIKFHHPQTHQELSFSTPIPISFSKLF